MKQKVPCQPDFRRCLCSSKKKGNGAPQAFSCVILQGTLFVANASPPEDGQEEKHGNNDAVGNDGQAREFARNIGCTKRLMNIAAEWCEVKAQPSDLTSQFVDNFRYGRALEPLLGTVQIAAPITDL